MLHGLDRLRAIPDRNLAADLFTLYRLADRNSAKGVACGKAPAVSVDALRRLATRALGGEFGAEGRELAEHFLATRDGRSRSDDDSLRAVAWGLRRLRRETG